MRTSETIDKSIKLKSPEDYNFLRREGIKHVEKLGGDLWTDFNTHDPGITLLESLCYAITDLAYRTGFDMKDLLAKASQGNDAWKNIFYTAREILPCNPLTINDYRKLVMDIDGVRNAWITISKDVEVPLFINRTEIKNIIDNPPAGGHGINTCDCDNKIRFPYISQEKKEIKGLVYAGEIESGQEDNYKIIELNGLYKIIVEYEEDIREKKKENDVRKQVLKVLHRHRNVCEDYLSVTGAEYKDFFLQASVLLSENTDVELVLAEMCYQIQNYFTPVIKFHSLDEMQSYNIPVDEIFEGPALKHGFIIDEELEKTDMFRDMRLSDIINFISDIGGVKALEKFKITEGPVDDEPATEEHDSCSNEDFFAEWIDKIKKEKLVGRLSIDDMLKFFHPSEDDLITPVSEIHFYKPSGEVSINTDRFEKLLNDLRGRDKYMKMYGFKNNFSVPHGENMELGNFYPVQYQLPFTYRVGNGQLPLREGKERLIQSLQLKGYLAVFEQLFLNYLYLLDNMNEIFSFNDIKFSGKSERKESRHDSKLHGEAHHGKEEEDPDKQKDDRHPHFLNQIIHMEDGKLVEDIEAYKCLYYDAEKYLNELQAIIQPESDFEWQRNNMLEHLLARFNEQMNEYDDLMKYMYPDNYLLRIIKNKTDLLSDYPAISNNRGRSYNYKLEEEETDYENATWDEDKIALNISGLEKRIARLLGLHSYRRRDLSPNNLFIEKIIEGNKKKIKVVLYKSENKKEKLLETKFVDAKCGDELMHAFIESGCCNNNFRSYPEHQLPHKRIHHHHHHEFSFALKDKKGRELALSPLYHSPEHRDEAMELAKRFLEKICHNEGFHMIEHILLRPKGDTQLQDEEGKNYGDEFRVLDICLDKCDMTIKQDATAIVYYKFDLQILSAEECLDGRRWKVILNRVRSKDKKVIPPVKIFERTFKDFELASDFIAKVREYGSELINFTVYQSKSKSKSQSQKDRRYYFKLKDKIGNTIVESSCFERYSLNKDVEEESVPGKRTECNELVTEWGIMDEIAKLKEFLAYELDLYCCEEACDHNVDPYSFRLTFVLPCWPERFRDKGFRKFVEKTILSETPAHIQARIFWLGITEMRDYEEAYFNWLIEMSANDVPDIGICNSLINQFIHLKNCDDHCEDKQSIYLGKGDSDKHEK